MTGIDEDGVIPIMKISWIQAIVARGKKLVIAVIGFTVLLIGAALLVLPGPAFIVLPLGLAILATEFVWASQLLKKLKNKFQKLKGDKHEAE